MPSVEAAPSKSASPSHATVRVKSTVPYILSRLIVASSLYTTGASDNVTEALSIKPLNPPVFSGASHGSCVP